jgi:hypothetical protein
VDRRTSVAPRARPALTSHRSIRRVLGLARERPRLLFCVAWPILLTFGIVSVVHFLRYRLGVEIYWTWEPRPTLAAAVALLMPILLLEATIWKRRTP